MRFNQVYDGEWVRPLMRGWRCKCCKCGLVHTWQFRVAGRNVEFRAWRHPRRKAKVVDTSAQTSDKRRAMKINLDTLRHNAGKVLAELINTNARRATAFISPTFVISANRRMKPNKRETSVDVVVKMGKPNFAEREFIALCKKSGTAFPLREPQLKFYPAKTRKSRKR